MRSEIKRSHVRTLSTDFRIGGSFLSTYAVVFHMRQIDSRVICGHFIMSYAAAAYVDILVDFFCIDGFFSHMRNICDRQYLVPQINMSTHEK